MARKICTAGVVGSFSFMVFEYDKGVISCIRNEHDEITTEHIEIDFATQWTERRLRELIGKQYEDN